MSADIEAERLKKFLADLTTLSRRHGIVIHGCGCCGSPSLLEFDDTWPTVNGSYAHDSPGEYGPSEIQWKEPDS